MYSQVDLLDETVTKYRLNEVSSTYLPFLSEYVLELANIESDETNCKAT